ncbi:MAG: phosphotransferase [Bacteroidales bacterium]|nr:phosphotransferase [Bacteroidales bacterium]
MEDSLIQQQITELFQSRFSTPIKTVDLLPGAGSARRYYRIHSQLPYSVLACYGTNCEENETFIYFSSVFKKANIVVPEVFAVNATKNIYLISDLGSSDVLTAKQNMSETEIESLYKRILKDLIQIQIQGGKHIDFSRCFVRQEFDRTAMFWDLYYFKYYYLKISGIECNDQKLEEDFERIVAFLNTADRNYFMYRDFQSRNILLNDNTLGYIDYQGGMKGPLQYDVVSLLYQAKANLSAEMRERLLSFYINELQTQITIDESSFRKQFQGFVFIRILQTLGAYGFRGYIQRKEHFIQSIPQALENIKTHTNIIQNIIEIPYLSNLIEQLEILTIDKN